jgi:hypothetical protein
MYIIPIYFEGKWLLHAEPFFRDRELGVATKEEAQAKAVRMVRDRLAKAREASRVSYEFKVKPRRQEARAARKRAKHGLA